ncbi:MAG: hypothetical protein ACP5PV_00020 [Methanothrix sp.]|jgi:hypothetical protein
MLPCILSRTLFRLSCKATVDFGLFREMFFAYAAAINAVSG